MRSRTLGPAARLAGTTHARAADAVPPDGLADWLRDIIDANARAHGVDPETATWT